MDHKKKKKTVLLVSGVAGIALVAAGAGFFLSRGKASAHGKVAEAHADKHGEKHGEAHAEGHADAQGEHPTAAHESAEGLDIQVGGAHASAEKSDTEKSEGSDYEGEETAGSHWSPVYWLKRYGAAFVSVNDKVRELRRVDLRAKRLELENANLRLRVETLQLGCHAEFAERKTKNIESVLTKDTGTRIGRTLASIAYKPPTHLFPEQLYALAVSYFKAHDDEKAAVIMTYLTNLEQTNKFKTAQNLLMTGVAWYRIDNLEMADLYFGRTLETPAGGQNLRSHARARLWRGLVAKHEGKTKQSQAWLRELLDHHPRSTEAAWVNGGLAPTATATAEEAAPEVAEHESEEGPKRETASEHHGH
jgi:hypothetical protein